MEKDTLKENGDGGKQVEVDSLKKHMCWGRSQDGVLGGYGIRVSAQLGHLPGTGGVPVTR